MDRLKQYYYSIGRMTSIQNTMFDEYVKSYKHYASIYGPQTAVFFQVGKFFEFYDILDPETGEGQTTARKVIDFLGIKLTFKKASGPGNRDGIWGGIPTQSLHSFALRLTRENWTCVVIEETKEIGNKKFREMTRILSPGTHTELVENIQTETLYIGAVYFEESIWPSQEPPKFAATAIDLTTGEVLSYEGQSAGKAESWVTDDLVHFFQVHPPRELIVFWKGDAISCPSEVSLKGKLGLQNPLVHTRVLTNASLGALTNSIVREEILQRMFRPQTMLPLQDYLHIREKSRVEWSLTLLLKFIEDHFPSMSEKLHSHTLWIPEESVFLGNNVLQQVNILGTRLEESVFGMYMNTYTLMGKRAMRMRLLYPITNVSKLRERLRNIQIAQGIDEKRRQQIAILFKQMYDLARLHRKVQTYKVVASDILFLEQTYTSILQLQGHLLNTGLEMSQELIVQLKHYIEAFHSHFDIRKAETCDENTMFLPETKAPKTAAVEKELQALKDGVSTLVETLRVWVGLPPEALKIESRETLLYCVVGSKTTMKQVEIKLQTPRTQHPYPNMSVSMKKSGANLNIPYLETIHTKVFEKRDELQKTFQQELPSVCQSLVDSYAEFWEQLESWIAETDVTFTLARVSKERGFCCPEFDEDGESSAVEAHGLRHPLIEQTLGQIEYVKHDISLGYEDCSLGWLVYGMNASGKSSLMKALGISVLLAQCGTFVPATEFRLRPYKSIFTRILNSDNLWAGLSSFTVEMTELREILKRADEHSLVLGDELCSGTESISATSLVAAGLEWLSARKSCFIFASHLHGLLELDSVAKLTNLQIWHLRVRYEAAQDKLIYDRTLHRGPGNPNYGLEVASALNLPLAFLEKAHKFRHQLLGTTSDEESTQSSYNGNVFLKECKICKCALKNLLEVHHIRPQKEADQNGYFADGSHKDERSNLIVVCRSCHDKHHNSEIVIGKVKKTSHGNEQEVQILEKSVPKKTKSKWTEEEQQMILQYIKEKPNATAEYIKHKLQELNIKISEIQIRKLRTSLTEQSQ